MYVVKPDDTAELRPVNLGQRQGDHVVVTKGVAANERVVVTGQLLVDPGARCASIPARLPDRHRMPITRPASKREDSHEPLRALYSPPVMTVVLTRVGDPVRRAGLFSPAGERSAGGGLSRSFRCR